MYTLEQLIVSMASSAVLGMIGGLIISRFI